MRYLAVITLAVSLSGCATGSMTRMPAEERQIVEVLEHSHSQQEAFNRAIQWVATSYNSAQNVIQHQDKDTGTIVIKAIYDVQRGASIMPVPIATDYTLNMDVRDKKIRFTYIIGNPRNGSSLYVADGNQMKAHYERLKAGIMNAISTSDDF